MDLLARLDAESGASAVPRVVGLCREAAAAIRAQAALLDRAVELLDDWDVSPPRPPLADDPPLAELVALRSDVEALRCR